MAQTDEKTKERRYQILTVGYDEMAGLMRGDLVIANLPEGAEVITANHSFELQGFQLLLHHPSFDVVGVGHVAQGFHHELKPVQRVAIYNDATETGEKAQDALQALRRMAGSAHVAVIVDWRDKPPIRISTEGAE